MKLRVKVNGQSYDVDVEVLDDPNGIAGAAAPRPRPAGAATGPVTPPVAPAPAPAPPAAGANQLTSKIPGTVVEIDVQPGDSVQTGQKVLVIDAMKMNTPVSASQAGTVKAVLVKVGDAVKVGQVLIEFE